MGMLCMADCCYSHVNVPVADVSVLQPFMCASNPEAPSLTHPVPAPPGFCGALQPLRLSVRHCGRVEQGGKGRTGGGVRGGGRRQMSYRPTQHMQAGRLMTHACRQAGDTCMQAAGLSPFLSVHVPAPPSWHLLVHAPPPLTRVTPPTLIRTGTLQCRSECALKPRTA